MSESNKPPCLCLVALTDDLRLWENTRNSDAEIRLADGQVIKVHKLIVSRCEFFRAAFESGFKV